MQPTTLCNLDCSYCYLPERMRRREMNVEMAAAVASSIADQPVDDVVEVCWHGGEPLATDRDHMIGLWKQFEALRHAGRVVHSLQTNATLINDSWCKLITAYDVKVGISLDGPMHLNRERVDRAGRQSFDRAMAGIERLRAHGIDFSMIAVVDPSRAAAAEVLDFATELGASAVGINMEEREGINLDRPLPTTTTAREFWADAIAWSLEHPDTEVRELERIASYLRLIRMGDRDWWESHRFDPLPTVTFNGDVVLLSPELAGIKDGNYGDFIAGNVRHQSIGEILASANRLRYVAEFLDGLNRCSATCGFFDFCRGAQAGNRYFENGRFDTTETNYCRVSRQELVKALVETTPN
nr:cyclophane-forming radical SAM peptide maturase AmcB [Nocardioides sp. KC13]